MSLVLDGSAALAWCFDDESTPAIDTVMLRVAADGAVVPALWRLEVANGLHSGIRRGRVTPAQRDAVLTALAEMDIRTDPETDRYAWSTTVRLAERYRLTIYDASYLELAQRLSLPLASLDKALRDAGGVAGIALLGV
ncbi:MAG TPA: type II toxin-antitoxin system VapC family toxin [Stellaceae bacterium]|nr:type II toxin-antitoxin system VapC family toxin [Stellaceae bacterium]